MLHRINYYATKFVAFHTTMYSEGVKGKGMPYSKIHIKYFRPEKDSLKILFQRSRFFIQLSNLVTSHIQKRYTEGSALFGKYLPKPHSNVNYAA